MSISSHSEMSRPRSRTYTGDSRRGRNEKEKRLDGARKENALPCGMFDIDLSPALLSHSATGYEIVSAATEDLLYTTLGLPEEQISWEKEKQRMKFAKSGEERVDLNDRDRPFSPVQDCYSSFTVPPHRRRNSTAMPHRLGDRVLDGDYEELKKPVFTQVYQEHERAQKHHREKMARGIGALVQMHRDRDREQARLSEQEHCMDPGGDKVKAGNDDEIDVVSELEKDWEKSQTVSRARWAMAHSHVLTHHPIFYSSTEGVLIRNTKDGRTQKSVTHQSFPHCYTTTHCPRSSHFKSRRPVFKLSPFPSLPTSSGMVRLAIVSFYPAILASYTSDPKITRRIFLS